MPISPEVAAVVLFRSDRTCCVCRTKGKPVQIHHIDENRNNNKIENLAVLCLDCHTDTQIEGGFHRKLTSDVVILYRDNWLQIVERDRLVTIADVYKDPTDNEAMKTLTLIIEDLKENKKYVQLVMVYNQIGNKELRDKYVEKALSNSPDPETVLFLRSLQGKVELVPSDTLRKEISRLKTEKNWSQLGRVYSDIGEWKKAVKYYCISIINFLDNANTFTAAYYLKEMSIKNKLNENLFQVALKEAIDKNNLWLQIRVFEELGWDSELDELLRSHEKEIKQSGDPDLLLRLYRTLNDQIGYEKAIRDMYNEEL